MGGFAGAAWPGLAVNLLGSLTSLRAGGAQMRTKNSLAILTFVAVAVAATSSASAERAFVCSTSSDAAQATSVAVALRPVEDAQTRRLSAIDAITDSAEAERRTDAAADAYLNDRWAALSPLAAAGDAEAMARLAENLRDSDDPATIRVWLSLAQCSADRGNAFANDELARFWWHQKGDGSLADIQFNRSLALDYAGRAAAQGGVGALRRIGVYIAGNLHQYPAALSLAARVLELCARADAVGCQRALVDPRPYDYGQSSAEDAFWLGRLAELQPLSFAERRDKAWSELSPAEVDALRERLTAFQPLSWAEIAPQWSKLRTDILESGATSPGAPSACTTATPWCRGKALTSTSAGKPTR